MKAALAIVLALPVVVLSARVTTARHEPRRVSDGVVAHASALMRNYTKFDMTEDEVRVVLGEQQELSDAVNAHLANLHSEDRSQKKEMREKLRQRAQKGLAARGIQMDRSVGGKTQCKCFIEKAKFFDEDKVKLVDLDSERTRHGKCLHDCFDKCKGDEKYKFDPHEAKALGVDIGSTSRKVAQCKGGYNGQCKCLDATQSEKRVTATNKAMTWLNNKNFGNRVTIDVVHDVKHGDDEFKSPEECLQSCGEIQCSDKGIGGGIEIDYEAMCIDEW